MLKFFMSVIAIFLLISCGNNDRSNNGKVKAYFGDKSNNLIVIVDVDNMEVIDSVATGNNITYAAEAIRTKITQKNGVKKFYIDNRGSNNIDVMDASTNQIIKTIQLDFYPRSIDINKKTGYVVVSGQNKTMASVIDTNTDDVLVTVGKNINTVATGHPKWLNKDHFALLDRENNQIITYKIEKNAQGEMNANIINILKTNSPVHNLIPPEIHGKKGKNHNGILSFIYFASEEGTSLVNGAILKLEFLNGVGLSKLDSIEVTSINKSITPNDTGVHHHDFLEDQKTIYVGSKEGMLYIVDYAVNPMRIIKTINVGKGAGHTAEFKKNDIAIIINHTDKFITLMNTKTHEKIADIEVSNISNDEVGIVQTQSHPEYYFSNDGKYFYLFLTEEGSLVKVDLEEKKVVQRLLIGGHLSMGSFVDTQK